MLNKSTVQLMALGLIGSMAATSFADDSALIDALVRKGVLKKGEAEQLRAQACKDCASDKLGGKVSLGESVKQLNLTGDVRLRYQYTNQDSQSSPTNETQSSGYRLRLRINADYTVSDDFFAGFGLRTTGSNSQIVPRGSEDRRSADTDLANNYYSNYALGVSKAFIGWTPVAGVTLIGGKQSSPFYSTDMVWGSEVNPAGFSEQFDLSKLLGITGVQLNVNSGQFIVKDNTESDPNHHANRDAFIWQTQVVASAEVASGVKLTVAPGYYSSNGADSVEHTQIVLLPGDVSTELAGQKFKFQWDFAYNLDGANRNLATASGTDKLAWLTGVQIGENKKKGDWSAVANYRRVGRSAIDTQINDPDWALGDVNTTGFKFGVSYSLGNATTIGANYYIADNLRKSLGTPTDSNSTSILQADVSVKF